MLLTNIGKALVLIGSALTLRNIIPVIIPCKWDRQLMQEYELAKTKGEKPSLDAEHSHIRHLFFKIGVVLTGTGGLVWIIGYLLER